MFPVDYLFLIVQYSVMMQLHCIIFGLIFQIPKLPDIDPVLQKNAQIACSVMDRVPISELAGWKPKTCKYY